MSGGIESSFSVPDSQVLWLGGLRIVYNHPHDLLGIFEVYVLDVYKLRSIRPADVVIDVGAGVGDYAMAAAKLVGPSGVVVAIEPNPQDFATLSRNVAVNGFRNIMALNSAVGQAEGFLESEFKGVSFRTERRSLDSIVARLSDASRLRRPPDLIKMDIEGGEVEALRGMSSVLRHIRALHIELHRTKSKVDEIMLPLGFRFSRLTRSHYLLHSSWFGARHPVVALRWWRRLQKGGRAPPLRKLVHGIDVAAGDDLLVGAYDRDPPEVGKLDQCHRASGL